MNSRNYKLGCILYSRMKSSRFPEKARFKLEGIPLLERVIQRTKKINEQKEIIIATSIDKSDDYICDIAKNNNIAFHRGSLENVFERTIEILKNFNLDYFARICGDRPLLDPFVHELAFNQCIKEKLDLCSSLYPKILPPGLTVEVISAKSFLSINKNKISDFNKEHITNEYYENPNSFKIKSLSLPPEIKWSNVEDFSYTLDERKDIDFLNYNIRNLENVKFGIKYHSRLKDLAYDWNKIVKNNVKNI